jgi:hypothetical protein
MDMPVNDPNDPNINTNDFVRDQNGNNLYEAQPLDVQTWLEANATDTTQVMINQHGQAVVPWSGTLQYASVYLEAFDSIYPNLAPAS